MAFASASTTDVEYLCRPERPILRPGTTEPVGPIYLSRNLVTGEFERLDVTVADSRTPGKPERKYQATRAVVPPSLYQEVCAFGYSVAILPDLAKSKAFVRGDRAKGYVPSIGSVPSSFSIAIYYGIVLGNFWVPASMPSAHGAHLVDFSVQQVNFINANSGTHFVQVQTAVSDRNFTSDFDGKGFYFGLDATYCGSSSPVYTSVAETWTINSAAGNVVVWDQTKSPNTCAAMPTSVPVRFLAGANRSQQSQYWRYDNGAPTPTFQSGVVNSYDPYFRAGGAGTAFLVAGFGSYPGEYWALYFQNVASWTQ